MYMYVYMYIVCMYACSIKKKKVNYYIDRFPGAIITGISVVAVFLFY